MAEETEEKEDLSVEDILSSIKDILMEDNAEQQKLVQQEDTETTSDKEQPEENAIATAEETADDVLTLSPSMIVEPSLSTAELQPEDKKDEEADPLDIDFEREFNNLPSEPTFDDVEDESNENKDIHSESIDEDPVDLSQISETEDADIEQNGTMEELEKIAHTDVDAEPIFSSEDDASQLNPFANDENEFSLDNLVDDETLNAILSNQPSDPEAESSQEDFLEPTDNVYDSAVVEEKANMEIISEPEEAEPKKEEIPTEVSKVKEINSESSESDSIEDTTDVSAGIISNFAKMFAEQQKQKQEAENKEEAEAKLKEQVFSQIDLGNGSLSIEVLVRDVISAIVEKHLSKDYDYSAVAAAEIARQTKNWLNAHLPEIVEAEVKKEIERVMAKVSS